MTVKQMANFIAKELGYDSLDQMKRHIQYLRRLSPVEFRDGDSNKNKEGAQTK